MANVLKKENLTIAIREYTNGQGETKKVWKTIGELITWDDGKQSFEMWGPTGATKGSVFSQDDNSNQSQQGGYQQSAPQGGYQAAPQAHGGFNNNPQGGYQPSQQGGYQNNRS